MVTSDLRVEVEIWPFCTYAMNPAIIIGTVRSLWTWLWGRYHVPQNVFLVTFIHSNCYCLRFHTLEPRYQSFISVIYSYDRPISAWWCQRRPNAYLLGIYRTPVESTSYFISPAASSYSQFFTFYRAALNAGRSSQEKAVCLSVCLFV